jgi:DNA-binding FrmR family transcriptional regulator
VNTREKSEVGTRLKRIAGQITGIERMVEDDRALPDVITQVSAARAALASVANILLARHVDASAPRARASGASSSISWCGCSRSAMADGSVTASV